MPIQQKGTVSLLHLRTCIWLLLQCRESDFFCLIACACSSWSPVNIATSGRSIAYAAGNTGLCYVAEANTMCARSFGSKVSKENFLTNQDFNRHEIYRGTMIEIVMNHDLCRECEDVSFGHAPRCCLLCLLIVARGGTFMLEQPGGSYMEYYDKMIWLYSQVPVFWHQQFSLFVTPSPPVINCTIGNIVLLS